VIALTLRVVAVLAAVLVIFSSRSHSSQSRGFGIQTPGGYQVSDVKYWTDEQGFVEGVDFELDAPAREVAALVSAERGWFRCTRAQDVLAWRCPATGEPLHVNDADTFQVRAY
jgi:hypothetical protein